MFIAADMAMFGLLFVSFMLERQKQPRLFETSRQALDAGIGGLNTLILLTSSWLVALAVDAARRERLRDVPRFLAAACACGVAFGVSKAFEYAARLRGGVSMMTNDFYMYYYALTGIHLLHVAAGTVVLGLLWRRARAGASGGAQRLWLECGASYWHMVDLLWIVLFPLLYLTR